MGAELLPIGVPTADLLADAAATGAARPSRGEGPADIRKAAREFEAYFVAYLLKVMRETVPTGLLGSQAADTYYYFYDQEIARLAAEGGGLGLANFLEEHLSEPPPGNGGSRGP